MGFEPVVRPLVNVRSEPKKFAKRGLSVGRQAAMMPTCSSTLLVLFSPA